MRATVVTTLAVVPLAFSACSKSGSEPVLIQLVLDHADQQVSREEGGQSVCIYYFDSERQRYEIQVGAADKPSCPQVIWVIKRS